MKNTTELRKGTTYGRERKNGLRTQNIEERRSQVCMTLTLKHYVQF